MTDTPKRHPLDVPGNRKIGEGLKQAYAFHRLSELGVQAHFEGDRSVWLAVTPTLAFAVELYLKVLSAIQKSGTWPKGHKLDILFKEHLPEETRAELERRYSGLIDGFPMETLPKVGIEEGRSITLDAVLKESSEAFSTLRYAFESAEDGCARQLPDAFGLWWFASILRPYVDEAANALLASQMGK